MHQEEDYFDFEVVDEEPLDLDFENLKPCPYCKKPIPQNSLSCLYCGSSLSFYKRPKWIIWITVVVIVLFLLLIILL